MFCYDVAFLIKFGGSIFDFSDYITDWASFGSYFGSITGLLAFLGVLYTVKQSNERADKAETETVKREERDLFFKLLDLHQNKLNAISFQINDSLIYGVDAIKQYAEISNKYIYLYTTYCEILNNKVETFDPFLIEKLKHIFSVYDFNELRLQLSLARVNQKLKLDREVFKNFGSLLEMYTNKAFCSKEIQTKYFTYKYVANMMYKEYGHQTGHYFRNLYYILNTIDGFHLKKEDKEYYAHILRAQFSRFELSLLFFNSISEKSSVEMITLIQKYDMLNSLYYKDIVEFKESTLQNDIYIMFEIRKKERIQ